LQTSSGTRFGRYELLEQIGAGGMGEVFRARDHDLHRDVAIKFLPEQFASDPDRLARFAQEARTASGLNHPNIITIHDSGDAAGRQLRRL
jgi:serine/threonine protein kinase